MIRRPPRSTPFPTRRSSDLAARGGAAARPVGHSGGGVLRAGGGDGLSRREDRTQGRTDPARSEEHTSELQSRQYLVCRLLLEKNKNTAITRSTVRIITPIDQ